jgi:hypothetical protein
MERIEAEHRVNAAMRRAEGWRVPYRLAKLIESVAFQAARVCHRVERWATEIRIRALRREMRGWSVRGPE